MENIISLEQQVEEVKCAMSMVSIPMLYFTKHGLIKLLELSKN